jgi:hypothetical protein
VAPVAFLPDERVDRYASFAGVPGEAELDRCFFLDDADVAVVGRHRGDHNRLGFAVKLTTLRFLGAFLPGPLDVPRVVLDHFAAQLGVADPPCVKSYAAREKTRLEHQSEIVLCDFYREFSETEVELSGWLSDLSWTTGDDPAALFDAAFGWLRQQRVLLPGLSTLVRLVASVRAEVERAAVECAGCSGQRSAGRTASIEAADAVTADHTHRQHAVIENVNADLKSSALAHLPSGKFTANAAWLVCAVMAFNLTRAAATISAGDLTRAATATIRRQLISVPARIASSARRHTLHLPEKWPWQTAWTALFTHGHKPSVPAPT